MVTIGVMGSCLCFEGRSLREEDDSLDDDDEEAGETRTPFGNEALAEAF